MAYIIRSDGTHAPVRPEGKGGRLTLKQLQKLVGGYIENVRLTPKLYMIVNETGKVQRDPLPKNPLATEILRAFRGGQDWIAGDAVLASEEEVR